MRRAIWVVMATVVGLAFGILVNVVGVFGFPGVLFGEAALTHSDGKPNFYDRTTWWDVVPLVGAALGFVLAWLMTKRRRVAPVSPQQRPAQSRG